jgi:hypothetical protein
MQDKDYAPDVQEMVFTGEPAHYLYDLLTFQTDAEHMIETLDELFEVALWGEGHNGSAGDNCGIEYHRKFGTIRKIKKLILTVNDQATKMMEKRYKLFDHK